MATSNEDARGLGEARRVDLGPASAVPEGGSVRVEADGLTVALFKVEGAIYVTDDHCTHGPGSLSQGVLDGFEIECDFHQGCFDVRTGAVTAPPCMVPVRTYLVAVEDGRVIIEA